MSSDLLVGLYCCEIAITLKIPTRHQFMFYKWSRAKPRPQGRGQIFGNSFLLLIALVPRGIAFLAHGLSAHLDAMGIVHQAVEDAVGESGIADLLMPARHGQLRREDSGTCLIAIVEDFTNLATFRFLQRRHGPVINDQHIDATESCDEVA